MRGPFLWGRRARGRIVEFATSPAVDLVSGEHDGYERFRSPVRHRRHVVFVKPDYVWVRDELLGSGEHLIESFLPFAPGMMLELGDAGSAVVSSPGGVVLDVLALGEPRLDWDWFSGSEEPLAGWVSPSFGVRVPAPVLRLVTSRTLPAALHLLLRPRRAGTQGAGAPGEAAVHALDAGHVLVVSGMPGDDLVAVGGGTGVIPGDGPFAGAISLEGEVGLVRAGADGLSTCSGKAFRRLAAGGRVIAEATGEPLDFCFRRLGAHAVVVGRGGTLRLLAPGVLEVRRDGARLPVERAGDWIEIDLGASGGGREMV
jgi:hypothetical protein